MRKKKIIFPKFTLGIALVIIGVIFLLGKPEELVSSSSFASEPVKIAGFSVEDFDESQLPKRVIIPHVNIDLEVRRSKVVNGYWEVFDDVAGWGDGSGIPGKQGNQVIFAHAREGFFLPLRSIKVGENIYILTEDSWYKYEVSKIKEVYPNETEVIEPTSDEILTLYTCSGFADSKRLIVQAKRI